jgi:hypothetical protein
MSNQSMLEMKIAWKFQTHVVQSKEIVEIETIDHELARRGRGEGGMHLHLHVACCVGVFSPHGLICSLCLSLHAYFGRFVPIFFMVFSKGGNDGRIPIHSFATVIFYVFSAVLG